MNDQPQNLPSSDEIGFLTVRARTAGEALPVAGAQIRIIAAPPGGDQTAAILFTDPSGNTPPIALPAPPASASQTPGGGTASFRYHILTDAPGYYSVQNLFVPIYAGVTAIQTVHLIPYPDLGQTPPLPSDQIRFNESALPDL